MGRGTTAIAATRVAAGRIALLVVVASIHAKVAATLAATGIVRDVTTIAGSRR